MDEKYFFQTENASVGYKGIELIHDINVGIYKGEILTLIGPNGSGKSTFLKSIIKELKTIKGTIYIDGKNINEYSSKKYAEKMAVVLTGKINTEMMTCRDFVSMGRYPYTNFMGKLTEDDLKAVEDALKIVHARDIADNDFMSISDGQRQRVILARAICQEPEMIVLDEPTSFLDIKHKIELLDILRDMASNKKVTVIMSLHEIDLAYKISDYIVCIDSMHRIKSGTPDEIFKEDIIKDLYQLDKGSYNVMYGSVELECCDGQPVAAVIGGAGYGISVYRELQKFNVPFAAGVIFKNDMDYPVASALAKKIVEEDVFSTIKDDTYKKMCDVIDGVKYVIDCGCPVGDMNKRNSELLSYAKKSGKIVLRQPTREDIKNILK